MRSCGEGKLLARVAEIFIVLLSTLVLSPLFITLKGVGRAAGSKRRFALSYRCLHSASLPSGWREKE
jgi:hypothetical protein